MHERDKSKVLGLYFSMKYVVENKCNFRKSTLDACHGLFLESVFVFK